MNKIKAAIIEDEVPAARLLSNMLQELRPEWEIILLPGTIEESVEWFRNNPHPDILFLDIQLTDGISFMFIEQAKPDSMIVFTTAYDEYAVRAFTVNSIDYLLKPVHKERLLDAINKFERLNNGYLHAVKNLFDVNELMKVIAERNTKTFRTRFLVTGNRRFYTVMVTDIAYFYSEEKITYAVTHDKKTHVIDLPLSKLEEELDDRIFFRVNRQFILSADSVRNIEPYFYGRVVIQVNPSYNGQILVSREKITALKMWLNT